jgi:hypothetical protein
MKKLILILVFISAGVGAFAQQIREADIPASVKSTFSTLYPDAKVETWTMKNGNYMAKTNSDLGVLIGADGKLIETEKAVPIASLPAMISEYVISNYPATKISNAYSVTSSDGRISYKAEVGEVCLFFDYKGEFIKSEMKSEVDKVKT